MFASRQAGAWSMALALAASPLPLADVLGELHPARLQAQDHHASAATCAATGYLVDSRADPNELGSAVAEDIQRSEGAPLEGTSTWVLPAGVRPVVVLDSTRPVTGGSVDVHLAGWRRHVAAPSSGRSQDRFVMDLSVPYLGTTSRVVGLTVTTGDCEVSVVLAADRGAWSTRAGIAAMVVTFVSSVLVVVAARLRRGGWLRRCCSAAPFGVLAGVGQAVLLYETGAARPFDWFPWLAPLAGIAIAAALPMTRARRRLAPALAPEMPPAQAPLGRYRIDQQLGRTDVAGIYRATNLDSGECGLIKVALPMRYGEPATLVRLEREARALAALAHPNVLRLQATIAGAGGPPTLVFEDLDGLSLRQLLDRDGPLSGPRAVSVVLGVLAGLSAVHARELVHRDIRPENVWLTADGRVLITGFELACVGVEHPLMPEGPEGYRSPEQLAGRALDGRSDLWMAGVLLSELLASRPAGERPPDPFAALLARVLVDDPAGRLPSAAAFADELRTAAREAYGADWLSRGALAGAVVAHGAVAAAAGGYALGGVTAGGSAPLTAGIAGLGAAAPTGSAAGLGSGQAGGAAVGVAPAMVSGAVAVAAGLAVVAGPVLIDPLPAQAVAPVVTPALAHVIFVRTVDEALDGDYRHLVADLPAVVENLLAQEFAVGDAELTGVAVGVPAGQEGYPAWFLATATLRFVDGTVSVLARFDRASTTEPWLMTSLAWFPAELGAPALDVDGWLVASPPPSELVVHPDDVPRRYADWFDRSWEAAGVVEHDLLRLRDPDGFFSVRIADAAAVLESGVETSTRRRMVPDAVEPVVVPLVDQRVLVWFEATMQSTAFNRRGYSSGPCREFLDERHVFFSTVDERTGETREYRVLASQWRVSVLAWVPAAAEGSTAPGRVEILDAELSRTIVHEQSVPC